MSHACFNQDNDSEQEQQQTEQKTQLMLCLQKTFDWFSEEKIDRLCSEATHYFLRWKNSCTSLVILIL